MKENNTPGARKGMVAQICVESSKSLSINLYEPRYVVDTFLIARAATKLEQPGIDTGIENEEVQVGFAKREKNGGNEGEKKVTKMRVPPFRRRRVLLDDGTSISLPIISMKGRIRGAYTKAFMELTNVGLGRFMDQAVHAGVFSIKDEATVSPNKSERDEALALDKKVKELGWHWGKIQEICGTIFTPLGISGPCIGRPAKGKFAGDFIASMTAVEVKDAPAIRDVLEFAMKADPDFGKYVHWIPIEESMFTETGVKRVEYGRPHMYASEVALPNTTWLLYFHNSAQTPLSAVELDNYILGWKKFATAPFVGAKGGRIDGSRLVFWVLDMKTGKEDIYVGSWLAFSHNGLNLKKVKGDLGLDLHENVGEYVAKHVSASRKYIEAMAPVTMSLGGMKTIEHQCLDWYKTFLQEPAEEVKKR
jgi:hypothetical protein